LYGRGRAALSGPRAGNVAALVLLLVFVAAALAAVQVLSLPSY